MDHAKSRKISLLIVSLLFSFSVFSKGSIKLLVNLSPAGSFEVKSSKVKGSVSRSDGGFTTKGISVKVKSLDSGLELRDDHLKDKLEGKKYKKIKILNGTAKGGKGTATIQVKNIKKKFNFTYKEAGSNLKVKFKLNLKDFKFSGIKYAGIGVKDMVLVEAMVPIK